MKEQEKHTPGPWTPYNCEGGRIFKCWRINAGTFHKVATIAERESSAEEHANALLIASAPAMLAMLKKLSNGLSVSGRKHYGVDEVIAQATGKAVQS